MSEGRISLIPRPMTGRGIPRPRGRRVLPPRGTTAVPRAIAAAPTGTGTSELPPRTIADRVAAPTTEDDWIRRAPSGSLILPPPPQFADRAPLPYPRSRPPPNTPLPSPPASSLPPRSYPRPHATAPAGRLSRSHAAAPATRLSRSHAARAPATRPTQPHGMQPCAGVTPAPQRPDALPCASYAAVAALPATARPPLHTAAHPTPTQPRRRRSGLSRVALQTPSRTPKAPRGKRRRRRRAPRPPLEPLAAETPQPSRLSAARPHATDGSRAPLRARAAHSTSPKAAATPRATRPRDPAPPSPDFRELVRVVVEALTTDMAAYLLREELHAGKTITNMPRANSESWRTRAGEIPAQISTPGK